MFYHCRGNRHNPAVLAILPSAGSEALGPKVRGSRFLPEDNLLMTTGYLTSLHSFSLSLALLMLLQGLCLQGSESEPTTTIRVNQSRLQGRIARLGQIGRTSKGLTRLAFTEADLRGRGYVAALMKEAGLQVRIDTTGNIVGRRQGLQPGLPAILLGSHIDTVPLAGAYDGVLGVMAAIECVQRLQESRIQTEHPIEVLVFSNEEGGMTGSRALAGRLNAEALQEISRSGKSIRDGIGFIGGNADQISRAVRNPEEVKAYLELHIEQGGILESEGKDIGIVEGFVGIRWWDVTVRGFANHAGTTPMNVRRDALLAAAELVIAVNRAAKNMPGEQVATVGRIGAEPGAPNVIPGRVELSLELRDLSRQKVELLFRKIRQRSSLIEKNSGTTIEFNEIDIGVEPTFTDQKTQVLIRQSAEALGLSYRTMPSGAAHDAQNLAHIAPSALIFVPSAGGISHSPREHTRPRDVANGANLLLQTLIRLDRQAGR